MEESKIRGKINEQELKPWATMRFDLGEVAPFRIVREEEPAGKEGRKDDSSEDVGEGDDFQ